MNVTIPFPQLTERFTGQVIRKINTMGRGKGERPWVLVVLDTDKTYALHTVVGWKLVSSMINTLRYGPQITTVQQRFDKNTATLTAFAVGGYKVAEFVALFEEGTPTGWLSAFELIEVTDG